jgi:hypothetical protein
MWKIYIIICAASHHSSGSFLSFFGLDFLLGLKDPVASLTTLYKLGKMLFNYKLVIYKNILI